jgi:hypothetical protein
VVSTPPVPPGGDDLDPTGIRALLSSLPDPGPMPADLVDRINASIAAEQSAREHPTVVPLRSRRWGWQQVGVAAAAAAVIAIGVPALITGTGPGDVIASLRGGGSSADSASGSAASLQDGAQIGPDKSAAAPEAGAPSGEHRVSASVGDVALGASGTAYTLAGLASQARDRAYAAADSAKTPAAESGADTGAGLRACLTALGVPASTQLRGDVATLDGAPAVIVVVTGASGASGATGTTGATERSVYAVSPDCDGTHPLLLAGPLPLL